MSSAEIEETIGIAQCLGQGLGDSGRNSTLLWDLLS